MPGLTRLRALPWALLLEAGVLAGRHWRELSPSERRRLSELVRASRGRVGNLNRLQRSELRRLVGKLDLRGLARELSPLPGRGRRRR